MPEDNGQIRIKVNLNTQKIGEKFDEIMNSRVGKAIRNAVSAINKLWQSVSQVISMIWELLKPFIKWLIEGFIDRISEDIKNISITIMEVVGNIIDLIGNVWRSLEGLIDLVSGIFTGDWERAWKGSRKSCRWVFRNYKIVDKHGELFN